MTDEHLLRQWADSHSDFSSDLDRGLLRLGRFVRGQLKARGANSTAYASAACPTLGASETIPATARAALAGVIACVATTGLLFTVALLATADLHHAAAHMTHAIVA